MTETIKQDYNYWFEKVKQNPTFLEVVPDEHKDYNLCYEAVKLCWCMIRHVPEEHRTKEIYVILATEDSFMVDIEDIPHEYLTAEICLNAVINNVENFSKQKRTIVKTIRRNTKTKNNCRKR